jgi:thiamine pyrophosphokinase
MTLSWQGFQIMHEMWQIRPIVQAPGGSTLVGGAGLGRGDLDLCLSHAPTLVAIDSGADAILAAGLRPVAVIGDMDSIGSEARAAFGNLLYRVDEQETTDFDKALRHVTAPFLLAVGVAGGRVDHALAVLHSLVAHPDRRCIVVGEETVTLLCPPRIEVALDPGAVVSLFPMVPGRVASRGLEWPTDGLALAAGERVGTSNRAVGPVTLEAEGPGMLLILPRAALGAVIAGLRASDARWPARAR